MFGIVSTRPRDRKAQPRGGRSLPDRSAADVQEPTGPADRRVQRTRRLLGAALIELMQERGYDAITVQDVIDQADVGRSTFYTHFRDKEDLLASSFDDLRRWLRAERVAHAGARPLTFARGVIDHAFEEQRLFRAIVGRQSGRAVEKLFRGMVVELVREDLAAVAPRAPNLEPTVQFVAGGFMALLVWWLEAPKPLAPAAVDALFHRLARPAVTALRG